MCAGAVEVAEDEIDKPEVGGEDATRAIRPPTALTSWTYLLKAYKCESTNGSPSLSTLPCAVHFPSHLCPSGSSVLFLRASSRC